MNNISDIEKQNILQRKKIEELSRKVNALGQEVALLNYEKNKRTS